MLENPAWLAAWTQHWHLSMSSPPDAMARAAQQGSQRRMMEDMAAQHPLTDTQLEELNTFLTLTPVQQMQRVPGRLVLVSLPLQGSWMGVVTQVAAAWAERLEQDAV